MGLGVNDTCRRLLRDNESGCAGHPDLFGIYGLHLSHRYANGVRQHDWHQYRSRQRRAGQVIPMGHFSLYVHYSILFHIYTEILPRGNHQFVHERRGADTNYQWHILYITDKSDTGRLSRHVAICVVGSQPTAQNHAIPFLFLRIRLYTVDHTLRLLHRGNQRPHRNLDSSMSDQFIACALNYIFDIPLGLARLIVWGLLKDRSWEQEGWVLIVGIS